MHCDLTLHLPLKKILLVKAVLDTTMRGSDVDTSLLLTCDNGGDQSSLTVYGSATSADETDYPSPPKPVATEKSLYELICDSNVEVSIENAVHFLVSGACQPICDNGPKKLCKNRITVCTYKCPFHIEELPCCHN